MTKIIAIAGKGGSGKTTFAAFTIRYLLEKRGGSILAVDADPNSNLAEALGLKISRFIADVLEEVRDGRAIPTGMSRDMFIEYKLREALTESERVDFLAMGGPQGPGCYCYANELLRKEIGMLARQYQYLVVDSEAGLEHISRRTIENVTHFFIMSDASARGVRSAGRIGELIEAMKINAAEKYLVITRVLDSQLEMLKPEIEKTGLPLGGWIPYDQEIVNLDVAGAPIVDVSPTSPALRAAQDILARIHL